MLFLKTFEMASVVPPQLLRLINELLQSHAELLFDSKQATYCTDIIFMQALWDREDS